MQAEIRQQPTAAIGTARCRGRRWSEVSVVGIVGLAVLTGFAFPEMVSARGNPSPTMTVQVRNYARASPTILAGAEHEAARILGQAGVLVVWLECPVGSASVIWHGTCERATAASDLKLRVLTAPTQSGGNYIAFGFTIHPALSSVYYEYALHRARSDNAEFEIPIILGAVVAHELGHLLLGSNAHSSSGIMQPRWDTDQFRQMMMKTLLFTAEQATIIQAAARNRTDLTARYFAQSMSEK